LTPKITKEKNAEQIDGPIGPELSRAQRSLGGATTIKKLVGDQCPFQEEILKQKKQR
jgi:hypothetical protein